MILHEAPKVLLRWFIYNNGERELQIGHWAEDTDKKEKFLVWEPINQARGE